MKASFIAADMLDHSDGAIDCILKGEAETSVAALVEAAAAHEPLALLGGPGRDHGWTGIGPPPSFSKSLDTLRPARDLLHHRRKYFIGVLDPCYSIEFSRGCPWDCSFCSAWTFYGRSYHVESVRRPPWTSWRRSARPASSSSTTSALHPGRARRAGHRRGDRPPGHPQALLPGDPRRCPAPQQGRLPVLEVGSVSSTCSWASRPSTRKGWEAISQACHALQELRGPGVRPVARDHGGDQPHRRPRLGPSPGVRGDPPVVPGDPGDRQHQREHALSRHRELAHRVAPADLEGLSALRHPARRPAHAIAPG